MLRWLLGSLAPLILIAAQCDLARGESKLPNVVLILADDLGYGDLSCYNPGARVKTRHLDQLAAEGMRFIDAHSASTVCTPSRYGILTGRMCFRTGYRGVFAGVGGPALIEANRLTLPQMLRERGYATACVGKWHLGLTFTDKQGQPAYQSQPTPLENEPPAVAQVRNVDFEQPVTDGPIHRGFDYFFGTACCPTTDWLYAYLQQDRVVAPPVSLLDRTALPQHPFSKDNRRGLVAPGFDLEEVDLVFLEKSQAWLKAHVRQHPKQPFFLFHSMQAVHLPSFAAKEFQGKTDAGPHGDFLFQMDAIVGRLLQTLKELNVQDETIVIFASDNGPEVTTVLEMRKTHQHDPAHPWRGMKRDNWEGGHRVPMIVRWPGKIAPGSVSNELTVSTDIMATLAEVVGYSLPHDAAEDSFSCLPVWRGEVQDKPVRPFALHQTISLALAIRQGPWKYLDHPSSGGNNYQRPPLTQLPSNNDDAPAQLYNLESDPQETRNQIHDHPEIAAKLKQLLEVAKATGRSRP